MLVVGTVHVHADTQPFTTPLYYGITNSAEVTRLQNFLASQGVFRLAPTGNFFSATQQAVIDFQKSQGIEQTGTFGPLTRAAASKILLAGVAQSPSATVSLKSISNSNSQTGSLISANEKTITWQTNGYPQGVGVNINLVKKTSTSPSSYSLVRQLFTNTANDGQEKWIPRTGETADNMYIEVTCSTTYTFTEGCKFVGDPTKVN